MTKEQVGQLFAEHIRQHPSWGRAMGGFQLPGWLTQLWVQAMLLVSDETIEYVDGEYGERDGKLEGVLWIFTTTRIVHATVGDFTSRIPTMKVWTTSRCELLRVDVESGWGGLEVWPPEGVQIKLIYPELHILLSKGYRSETQEEALRAFLPSLLRDVARS